LEFATTARLREDDSYRLGSSRKRVLLGPADSREPLKSSQQRHLLSSAQYADKLLSDIESILASASSKSPFPKFQIDLTPAQIKVTQDYLARIRAHLVRVLESQGIVPPPARFKATHAIRVSLGFADIAFSECRAENMLGYGEVPEDAVAELNGLVGEMRGSLSKLSGYLTEEAREDFTARLARLAREGQDTRLAEVLARVIDQHGMVEFRPAIAAILDRMGRNQFEIAVFGRVSSGKSSLLNYIVEAAVLPVGVTPVTSVPTRLMFGPSPRGKVWIAGKEPEEFEISRLPEFVTEQANPGNAKHVTRIAVEFPAARLHEGVVFVDTPGLGSLATAGAIATMAYLPRCDLGVVLVDAGSTLTLDDIATLGALREAAIPSLVLLSKADLLSPEDRKRTIDYVAGHIASELGLTLPVHAVSIEKDHAYLLEQWIAEQIAPLYGRHRELARQSLDRKIGALRGQVEASLSARLERPRAVEAVEADEAKLRHIETELRVAAGRFTEVRAALFRVTDGIREGGPAALARAADAASAEGQSILSALSSAAAEPASLVFETLRNFVAELEQLLERAGAELQQSARLEEGALGSVLKEMPLLDLGGIKPQAQLVTWRSRLSRAWDARHLEGRLQSQIGAEVDRAFANYGRMLEVWLRTALAALEYGFDTYADAFRVQLGRSAQSSPSLPAEQEAIRRDLELLRSPSRQPEEIADRA
jgi:GTP-binding protein EngB required for normal cell division